MEVLVDTDVLIWHPRGYAQSAHRLDQLSALTVSSMRYLELLQGMRNKQEMAAVQQMFVLRKAVILPLTPAITLRATELMATLSLSHGLQSGDALIAATALEHQLRVLTGNTKHFTPITGLEVDLSRQTKLLTQPCTRSPKSPSAIPEYQAIPVRSSIRWCHPNDRDLFDDWGKSVVGFQFSINVGPGGCCRAVLN